MSLYYSCKVNLKTHYNQETLLKLLERGKRLGFIYFNLQSYSGDLDISTDMSAKEALNYLISGEATRKDDINFPKNLTIQYDDTIFTLKFYGSDYSVSLNFFVLENPWKKICDSDEYIDFGRYVKLWINMCDDFCIYKIETSID